MSRASTTDLAIYFDERAIEGLASDTGEPDLDWPNNQKIKDILSSADGRIEAACTVANLYEAADLDALTGSALQLYKEIACCLAMAILIRRRQGKYRKEYEEQLKEAEDYLGLLRKGERVFGIVANRDAGMAYIDGPDVIDYDRMNLLPDRTKHYYPSRSSRLPTDRNN